MNGHCRVSCRVLLIERRAPHPLTEHFLPFYSRIAGVSYKNRDGSSRQAIIRRCRIGEPLRFQCEPDNPVDPKPVAILRANGEQVGYLEARTASELHREIASGELIPCYITDLTGGTRDKPTRGVNIYIGGEPPPEPSATSEPFTVNLTHRSRGCLFYLGSPSLRLPS